MTREDVAEGRVDVLEVGTVNRDHVCRVEALPGPGAAAVSLCRRHGRRGGRRGGRRRPRAGRGRPTRGRGGLDGGGDAFTGALAAALSTGRDLPSAVRVAVRAGAHAVTRPGAQASFASAAELGIAPLRTHQPEG